MFAALITWAHFSTSAFWKAAICVVLRSAGSMPKPFRRVCMSGWARILRISSCKRETMGAGVAAGLGGDRLAPAHIVRIKGIKEIDVDRE